MPAPRKPTAGFWIVVALVVVFALYPLSIGPALWLSFVLDQPAALNHAYWVVYDPVYAVIRDSPTSIQMAAIRYQGWWANLAGGFPPPP